MESPTFACTAVGKIYPVIIRLSGSCRWGSEVVSCPLSCTLLHPYPTADPSLCCTTNSYCKPTPYLVRLLLCSVSLDGAYYVSICSKGLDCNCTCHAGPCKFLASNARLLYQLYTPDLASTFDFSWIYRPLLKKKRSFTIYNIIIMNVGLVAHAPASLSRKNRAEVSEMQTTPRPHHPCPHNGLRVCVCVMISANLLQCINLHPCVREP